MATKATLINSAGKKVVVDVGSADAQNYFGNGYQLMDSSGKYTAPVPKEPEGAGGLYYDTGRSPITTSTGAQNEMNSIDQRARNIQPPQYEQPNDQANADQIEKERSALIDQQNTEIKGIQDEYRQKIQTQEQVNKGLMSQSRAALASLGVLGQEPNLTTSTTSVQYLDDMKIRNQREMAQLDSEETAYIQQAKNAREDKDFQLARDMIAQADKARNDRNLLQRQELEDAMKIREFERAGDAQALENYIKGKTEERAQAEFTQSKAENVLKYIDWDNFDQYSEGDIQKIEQTIGLPDGTLKNYASAAVKMKALEGWQSQIYNDKNTGEVKTVYTRISPTTGQPEFMTQSLGTIGERYQEPDIYDTLSKQQGIEQNQLNFEKTQAEIEKTRAEIEKIKTTAKTEGEKSDTSSYQIRTANLTIQSVDNLLPQAEAHPEIFGRTAAMPIPNWMRSDEFRNFEAQLNTLKSNIAFGELVAMREASKTGGALGQVSDREGKLLESSLGALDMAQSPENFRKNLLQIRKSIQTWQKAMADESAKSGSPFGNVEWNPEDFNF